MLPTHREQTSQDRPSRAPAVLPAGRERLLPAAWAPDIAQPRLGPSAGPWPPESPPCQPEGNAHPPSCRHMPYAHGRRSEEHTSELQSLMRISYAVFCLKKTNLKT